MLFSCYPLKSGIVLCAELHVHYEFKLFPASKCLAALKYRRNSWAWPLSSSSWVSLIRPTIPGWHTAQQLSLSWSPYVSVSPLFRCDAQTGNDIPYVLWTTPLEPGWISCSTRMPALVTCRVLVPASTPPPHSESFSSVTAVRQRSLFLCSWFFDTKSRIYIPPNSFTCSLPWGLVVLSHQNCINERLA